MVILICVAIIYMMLALILLNLPSEGAESGDFHSGGGAFF
jgi:hypothetical protein